MKGRMAELADAIALGAIGATLGGSNPLPPKNKAGYRQMIDKIQVMNRARLEKRIARDNSVKNEATELFEKYKNDPLFLSGIALYWAEGTRLSKNYRKYQLAFTNADSNLINFYCNFLQKYFKNIGKEDWRAGLFLYPDIKPEEAISYWSGVLGIPHKQFIKSQILEGKGGQNRRLRFGTCCVYVNSKDACLTMQRWIEAISNNAAVIQR